MTRPRIELGNGIVAWLERDGSHVVIDDPGSRNILSLKLAQFERLAEFVAKHGSSK